MTPAGPLQKAHRVRHHLRLLGPDNVEKSAVEGPPIRQQIGLPLAVRDC